MIITKTPLRIPIAGGGTDLPSFYKKHNSFFISAAINYYSYVILYKKPIKGFKLDHSSIEEVKFVKEIKQPVIRTALNEMKINESDGIEIFSTSDFPPGTGMGYSGSFTVGLLKSIYEYKNKKASKYKLAEQACHINMELLKLPSGKQDEYIASFGGFTCFEINKKGNVKAYPLNLSKITTKKLEKNLLMFYTGITRSSSQVLRNQKVKSENNEKSTIENLMAIQNLAFDIKKALEKGDIKRFGELLDYHWNLKRKRFGTSSPKLDKIYKLAKNCGATGGKLMGAGGGGFFIFYCEDNQTKLISALEKKGLQYIKFKFVYEGTKSLRLN